MFKLIEETSKSINNGRKPQNVFLQVVEEVGELSKELRTKYDPSSYKQEGVDGILGESCDILISLIDLLVLEGYTEEQVECTIQNKCDKWKSKMKSDESKEIQQMKVKDGTVRTMRAIDFKGITKIHIETCREIIKLDGWCDDVEDYQLCRKCPFHSSNAVNGKSCFENKYKKHWEFPPDEIMESSKQFIEQFENICEYIAKINNRHKEQAAELKDEIRALELDRDNIIKRATNGKTEIEIEIEEAERLKRKREHEEHLLWRKHHGNGRGIFL